MTTLEWPQRTSEAKEETGGYQLLSRLYTIFSAVFVTRFTESLCIKIIAVAPPERNKEKLFLVNFLNRKAFKLN